MAKIRKCSECHKEISSGKFYNFYTGKNEGKLLGIYNKPSNNNFGSQDENNPIKKGMSKGLKIFLGISVAVLVSIIIFIGVRGYKKNSERETKAVIYARK